MKHMIALGVIFTSVLCYATAFHPTDCDQVVNCVCQANRKGRLKFDNGKIFVCTGSRWKPLLYEEYGDASHPGFSCKDIQGYKGKESENGVYWIKLKGGTKFRVYCDMANGGWTMVFKAVGGVDENVYGVYTSSETRSEDKDAALRITKEYNNHYKNRIILNWKRFNPSEARVVLYKDGELKKELTFHAKESDTMNWFSRSRLIQSSWSDIQTQPQNYFSIEGADDARRLFFINRNYGGCPKDAGWMVVTQLYHCHWEHHYKKNAILYSKGGVYTNWNTHDKVEEADILVVYVR